MSVIDYKYYFYMILNIFFDQQITEDNCTAWLKLKEILWGDCRLKYASVLSTFIGPTINYILNCDSTSIC